MKGVSMIRLTYTPAAVCTEEACGWRPGLVMGTRPGARLRALAERHVAESGHVVVVDILDRTEYAPDGAA